MKPKSKEETIAEPVEEIIEPEQVAIKAPVVEKEKVEMWKPKTELGRKVKDGTVKDIDEILDSGRKILEKEIIDALVPDLDSDLLMIGQSKGKFGGGKRRVFRQTQKKTKEGNKPHFATLAVIGNKNGYVGVGYGKAKETVPAREKAVRNAKINLIKIRRGCGSWQCGCGQPHSIPFAVSGKCGSVEIKLMPAPKGKGLITEKEVQKILGLAGIKDVWSRTRGQTRKKMNLVEATMSALKQLTTTKVRAQDHAKLSITEGRQAKQEAAVETVEE
jgi:small subunit ribosomal protein S5